MLMRLDDQSDPGGRLRQIKEKFRQAREAYVAAAHKLHEATAEFLARRSPSCPELGDYPSQSAMDLEVAYNHWTPFRFAWVLMLIACLGVLLSMVVARKWAYVAAVAVFLGGVTAMLIGFGMRDGHCRAGPGDQHVRIGALRGVGDRRFRPDLRGRLSPADVLAAAAAISTLALVCGIGLRSNFQPLSRSCGATFGWPSTSSRSWPATPPSPWPGSSAISRLGFYLARSQDEATKDALARVTYWTHFSRRVLLETGTVLGAMWADDAWGRFWGWDRKEVWALITLLIYLAVLHARCVGWVGNRGLAALAAVGFALVVMAWYGVNFMGTAACTAMDSPAVADKPTWPALCSVQFLYVGLAVSPRRQGRG